MPAGPPDVDTFSWNHRVSVISSSMHRGGLVSLAGQGLIRGIPISSESTIRSLPWKYIERRLATAPSSNASVVSEVMCFNVRAQLALTLASDVLESFSSVGTAINTGSARNSTQSVRFASTNKQVMPVGCMRRCTRRCFVGGITGCLSSVLRCVKTAH